MKFNFQNFTRVILILFIFAFLLAPVTVFAQVGPLRIIVGGRELPAGVKAEQRGARVVLPITLIARELGYAVSIDAASETIKIRRPDAEAEFIKQSGEVRENGTTLTTVPFAADVVFTSNLDDMLLPSEAAALLLKVSLVIRKEENAVLITTSEPTSTTASTKEGNFEIGSLDYNYNANVSNGFFYQNLNLISTGRIGESTYRMTTNFLGGGNYRIINFYSGNFTLQRQNGSEIQVGDLITPIGSEMSLLNTMVRGASFTRPIFNERTKLSIYGGRSYSGFNDNNFQRNSPAIPFDTTLFGGRMIFHPYDLKPNIVSIKDLSFSVGSVYFSGPNNKGMLVDGTMRYRTKQLNFEAELAAGSFDSQGLDKRNIKGFGTGVILNGSYTPWRFLTLQTRYERFSPNFSNPARTGQYSNRETKSAGISMQPFKNLTFGANAMISDNKNPIILNGSVVAGFRNVSYGLNVAYDPAVKFLPRVSVNATKLRNPFTGDMTFVNANFAREFKSFRPFVNYMMTQSSSSTNHSFNLGTGIEAGKLGQFQAQYSFSLSKTPFLSEAEIRCQIEPARCPYTFIPKRGTGGSSIDWIPDRLFFNSLRFTVGAGYIKGVEKTSLQFRSSANIALPFKQNIQVSYYRSENNNDLRFSISGPLAFWKPKNTLNAEISNEALLTESTINGRVYQDENGNEKYDAGVDTSMAGVRVRLNNGYEVVSDINGNYSFDRISPGDHHLVVNFEDIRANLIPANGLEQTLTITPRTVVNTAFRLVKSGSLSGRLWHDANGNGKYEETEGLPDIHILSSSGRDTYSEYNGWFILTELPPGEHTIFIDERFQPENLMIASLSTHADVKSGQETKGIEFIFKTKPREVKEINFGVKSSPAPTPSVPGTINK